MGIVVFVLNWVAFFTGAVAIFGASPGGPGHQPSDAQGAALLSLMFGLPLLLAFIIGLTYYAGMTAAWGRTLGKMALGLQVVGLDGNKPGYLRAALRETIGRFLSGFVCCLGYLWMLWDPQQQTWHDKISGTAVVRA
jgi:uncharacterized RDD family membrane protein YckC